MREIKFRAWDKKSKKMRVVYCIVYDTNSQFSKEPKIKLVNLWGRIFPAYDDGECNAERLIQRKPKHVELMQYTGLKDKKNGVEIYEGDIVKASSYLRKGTFEVIFQNGCFSCGNFIISNYRHDIEVIGNKYEHPHLLGGE